jgi:uncharacterized protein YaiI (UPF0178 family)
MSRGHPWDGVAVLLVDGNNLLHALQGQAGPAALRDLLGRLAAAVPGSVDATVVLDGPPDPGAPMHAHVRRGLSVRHSGRASADTVIVELIEARPFLRRADVVAVTNDVELADRVLHAGGRRRSVGWLEQRLAERTLPRAAGGSGGSIGGPRPAAMTPAPGAASPEAGEGEPERRPWRPGRGATRKRGNPRRGARR